MKKGIIVAGMICLMISGCGKKGNVEDDFAVVQGTGLETEFNGQKGEAERTVEYTVDGAREGIRMNVNAVVDTSIPGHVVTEKVKQVVVDEEYLVSMAKNIFDNGEYEVLPPTGCKISDVESTMEEISLSLDAKASEYGGPFEPSNYYNILKSAQSSVEAGNEISDETMATEGYDEWIFPTHIYKGNINDKPYILEYRKTHYGQEDTDVAGETGCIQIYPMDGYQMRSSYVEVGLETDQHGENEVSYNDALSQAEHCIMQLGLDDYSLTRAYEALVDTAILDVIEGSGEILKRGYRFIFTPGVDGIQVAYCGGSERSTMQYDNNWESKDFWMQPVVQIDVDATGIRNIKVNKIYELAEVLSNDSNLISFDQADVEAKKAFEAAYVRNSDVTDIRLEYIIVKYEHESAMVPAWVYYHRESSPVSKNTLFAVNALDGSVIHFNIEYSSFGWEL